MSLHNRNHAWLFDGGSHPFPLRGTMDGARTRQPGAYLVSWFIPTCTLFYCLLTSSFHRILNYLYYCKAPVKVSLYCKILVVGYNGASLHKPTCRNNATATRRGRLTTVRRGQVTTIRRGHVTTVRRGRVTAVRRGRVTTVRRGALLQLGEAALLPL